MSSIENLKQLAVEAGQVIMEIYHTDFTVETKQDQSPLTIADQTANALIVKGLQKKFPECAILSEESRDDRSRLTNDYCFIVDPLDGTKEFIKRNGQFTINIALAYQHKAVMGVIYVPVTRELYFASQGQGAYVEYVSDEPIEAETGVRNERSMDTKEAVTRRLHVTDKLTDLVLVGSSSHATVQDEQLIAAHRTKIAETISAGSSLKGCMVAAGKADVYYRFGLTSEWDTAAMQCIVEEAGGIFRQMDGSEMRYNRENNLNEQGFYNVNRAENIWV